MDPNENLREQKLLADRIAEARIHGRSPNALIGNKIARFEGVEPSTGQIYGLTALPTELKSQKLARTTGTEPVTSRKRKRRLVLSLSYVRMMGWEGLEPPASGFFTSGALAD